MRIKTISFVVFLIITKVLFAQTSDEQYRLPLKEVLNEIQVKYKVKLKFKAEEIEGKWVNYARWRYRPDLEQTLTKVLSPLDMDFIKNPDGSYKIKLFEYYRWPVEEGKQWAKHLSGLYADSASWEKRKTELKSCLIETLKINKLPSFPASKPILVNLRKYEGYTIQNIALETLPGVYLTGSIYKPTKIKGKIPAMLCPNGHWKDGRYRPDQQYQCAMLAKLGIIAISYDLFAWGESRLQFAEEFHRTSLAMEMQVINSLRLLQYITEQKEVDTTRIGITGGSGAGSHAMLISAIDSRIKISIPAVMLSCYMFGGCPCESGLPVHLCGNGTNNIELAGMTAPRPQLIISDGKDWTANVPEIEFPILQRIYSFYKKEEVVQNVHLANEAHDYGPSKRNSLYEFVSQQFKLDLNIVKNKVGQIDESDVVVEPEYSMYVFDNKQEMIPANALKNFIELRNLWQEIIKP
jgi:hypothetical protein